MKALTESRQRSGPAPPESLASWARGKAGRPSLERLLEDRDSSARLRAAEAIGRIEGVRGRVLRSPAHSSAGNAGEPRAEAIAVLEEIGPAGKEALADLTRLLVPDEGARRVRSSAPSGRSAAVATSRWTP